MIEVSDRVLAELARPGVVVLIGETHGTCEFPELVGRLLQLGVARGLAAQVGLEVPVSEQPAIDAFMTGDGGPGDIEALTASSFWHRRPEHDDGRAGTGLVELFATARAAAATGAAVRVFALDQPWGEEGMVATPELAAMWSTPRDRFMAETVVDAVEAWHASQGRAFTVVLAGNMHTRIIRSPRATEPHLGELLVERFPHLVALDGHWTGGQFRASMSPRGAEIHDAQPIPTDPGSIGLHHDAEGVQRFGHHGWVNVGRVTPSLPVA